MPTVVPTVRVPPSVSRGRCWPRETRPGRSGIKKLRGFLKDDAVDLWALDEVHFQKQGSRCRMWIPPEDKDPVVFHHPTRKSVGYFGAVRLRDGRLVFRRQSERFNGETFWEFLRHLREATVEPGRRIILISDNAPYHRSRLHLAWRQQQQPQFALDFLPPYSPELNPIERVWKLTRRLCCFAPDGVDSTLGVSRPIESRCDLCFKLKIASCLNWCAIV